MVKFREGRLHIPFKSIFPISSDIILKGEDDGSIFASFLKESRFPAHLKSITWESVKEIMDTYKVLQITNWR